MTLTEDEIILAAMRLRDLSPVAITQARAEQEVREHVLVLQVIAEQFDKREQT